MVKLAFLLLFPIMCLALPTGRWNSRGEYSTDAMLLCRVVQSDGQWFVEDRLDVQRETDTGRIEGRGDTEAAARHQAELVYARKRYAMPAPIATTPKLIKWLADTGSRYGKRR